MNGLDIALWVGQWLLAAVFLVSGLAKVALSKQRLVATGQTGVQDVPLIGIRAIAVCELLASVGLILPWHMRIAPILTPLAALGLAMVMVGAIPIHRRLHEPRNIAINIGLLVVCLFVAVGRLQGL